MDRLLGWKFWTGTVAAYYLTFYHVTRPAYDMIKPALVNYFPAASLFSTPVDEYAPAIFALIFGLLFSKPIWRSLWRVPGLGAQLADWIFPDLNGVRDVELSSNWPRVDAMQTAAKDVSAPRFDANNYESVPLGVPQKFTATINQDWTSVTMKLTPQADKAVMRESQTIAFDLVRGPNRQPQIAYVYDQKNRAENVASTDENDVPGAALVTVAPDGRTMQGNYFTRRNWLKGLNTAGEVKFRRLSSPPLFFGLFGRVEPPLAGAP